MHAAPSAFDVSTDARRSQSVHASDLAIYSSKPYLRVDSNNIGCQNENYKRRMGVMWQSPGCQVRPLVLQGYSIPLTRPWPPC